MFWGVFGGFHGVTDLVRTAVHFVNDDKQEEVEYPRRKILRPDVCDRDDEADLKGMSAMGKDADLRMGGIAESAEFDLVALITWNFLALRPAASRKKESRPI